MEILYATTEEATRAKFDLNGFNLKAGSLIRVLNYQDARREKVEDRTVVLTNLPQNLSQQSLLENLSKYGHVMKLEMPMTGKSTKSSHLDNIKDKFLNDLEVNLTSVKNSNERDNLRSKFGVYFYQINTLISDFKKNINKGNQRLDKDALNNLLTNIRFYVQKFFPKEVVNSLLTEELEQIKSYESVGEVKHDKIQKTKEAYQKIIDNLQGLVNKYEDKIKNLAKPLTREDILIDLDKDSNRDPESNYLN